jgi:hypothetical protein
MIQQCHPETECASRARERVVHPAQVLEGKRQRILRVDSSGQRQRWGLSAGGEVAAVDHQESRHEGPETRPQDFRAALRKDALETLRRS